MMTMTSVLSNNHIFIKAFQFSEGNLNFKLMKGINLFINHKLFSGEFNYTQVLQRN